MHYPRNSLLLFFLLAASLLANAQGPSIRKPPPKDVAGVQDFEARISQYLKQRKSEAGKMPAPTKSAATLKETREQMRTRIQAQFSNARQGDIFTTDISEYFRKQIKEAFTGKSGARVLASMRHSEPIKEIPLKPGQPYPEGVPLQSTPPTLLLKLPKLPKELEYRIVGHNLVLLDIEPKLVVDVLPDAIPQD